MRDVTCEMSERAKTQDSIPNGDESKTALENLLIAIASGCPNSGAEYKTGDFIILAEDHGLFEAITMQSKAPCKVLAHRLRRVGSSRLTDNHGRYFQLGRRMCASGSVYTIRFIDTNNLEAAKTVTGQVS